MLKWRTWHSLLRVTILNRLRDQGRTGGSSNEAGLIDPRRTQDHARVLVRGPGRPPVAMLKALVLAAQAVCAAALRHPLRLID